MEILINHDKVSNKLTKIVAAKEEVVHGEMSVNCKGQSSITDFVEAYQQLCSLIDLYKGVLQEDVASTREAVEQISNIDKAIGANIMTFKEIKH